MSNILMHFIYLTPPFKSLGSAHFKEINTLIQQERKINSKDIYNVTKDFYFKKKTSFKFFIHQD